MCGTVFFDLFVVHASIFPHHFERATRPEMFLIECTAKYRDMLVGSLYLRYLQLVISLKFVSCGSLQSRARCELRCGVFLSI